MRSQSAKEKRDKLLNPFAIYEGIDPIDGTDRVSVNGEINSGFKLISNAPLSIGERVFLRENNQGGLQRVDARNRPPQTEIISTVTENTTPPNPTPTGVFGYGWVPVITTNIVWNMRYPDTSLSADILSSGTASGGTYIDNGYQAYGVNIDLDIFYDLDTRNITSKFIGTREKSHDIYVTTIEDITLSDGIDSWTGAIRTDFQYTLNYNEFDKDVYPNQVLYSVDFRNIITDTIPSLPSGWSAELTSYDLPTIALVPVAIYDEAIIFTDSLNLLRTTTGFSSPATYRGELVNTGTAAMIPPISIVGGNAVLVWAQSGASLTETALQLLDGFGDPVAVNPVRMLWQAYQPIYDRGFTGFSGAIEAPIYSGSYTGERTDRAAFPEGGAINLGENRTVNMYWVYFADGLFAYQM
jgi:hypothetical protein